MNITVTFLCRQSAEDVYKAKSTNGFFVRQPVNNGTVRWLTATKWKSGYEADCPLRDGTVITVVDINDTTLFEETMINPDNNDSAYAKPVGEFSYEGIRRVSVDVFGKYGLCSHDVWYKWLSALMPEGYEKDNWLYFDIADESTEIVTTVTVLGETFYIIKHNVVHTICGARFEMYTMDNSIGLCVDICGYILPVTDEGAK